MLRHPIEILGDAFFMSKLISTFAMNFKIMIS